MALNAAGEAINLVHSGDYAGMIPADVSARGQGSARGPGPRAAAVGGLVERFDIEPFSDFPAK